MLFTLALVLFGFCSMWTALVMFARIYPVLFPGKKLVDSIPVIGNTLATLPGPVKISAPSTDSVFNRRINFLVMGTDRRPTEMELDKYRTDTLMIATVDPVTKQASILSIPRDIEITINHPDGFTYEDRVNSSYAVGVENGQSFEAGAQQLMKDIKANFGVEIDYWIVMDFKGVEGLINAIGGIDVDVPEELAVYDFWYSDESGEQAHYVSFYPGMQHMTGYDAVAFGRYRDSGDGDLDRIRRQQLVLQTAMTQVFEQGLLEHPFELWDAYSNLVKTNIPRSQVLGLALLAKETGGDLATYSLGEPVDGIPTVDPFVSEEGANMLRLRPENVQKILGAMFTKATYAKSWVEIHDGIGGEDGDLKAEGLVRFLHLSKGLPTVYVGPDEDSITETTITVYSEDWRPMAEDIATWLGLPSSSIKSGTRPPGVQTLDVVVTIGPDYEVPGS